MQKAKPKKTKPKKTAKAKRKAKRKTPSDERWSGLMEMLEGLRESDEWLLDEWHANIEPVELIKPITDPRFGWREYALGNEMLISVTLTRPERK